MFERRMQFGSLVVKALLLRGGELGTECRTDVDGLYRRGLVDRGGRFCTRMTRRPPGCEPRLTVT